MRRLGRKSKRGLLMTNSLNWGYGCESRDISAKRRGSYDVFPPALVASTFALNRAVFSGQLPTRYVHALRLFTRSRGARHASLPCVRNTPKIAMKIIFGMNHNHRHNYSPDCADKRRRNISLPLPIMVVKTFADSWPNYQLLKIITCHIYIK